jgi:hypothetical protein
VLFFFLLHIFKVNISIQGYSPIIYHFENDYLLTGASRFIIYHQTREREQFILSLFYFLLCKYSSSFFFIIFPGRTTNGASGQSSTSPEKGVNLPRSATLSGQSM